MARFIAFANQNAAPAQLTNIAASIQNFGGRILDAWGSSVFIGEGTPALVGALRQTPGVALVSDGTSINLGGLSLSDPASTIGTAWNLANSPPFAAAWTNFLNGAAPGHVALADDGCGAGEAPPSGSALAPSVLAGLLGIPANHLAAAPLLHRTRRALVNTIGIAILEIDGPPGSIAAFQPAERITAIAGISRGIQLLESLSPGGAHLAFDVQIRRVRLNVDPNTLPFPANPARPTNDEYERIERMWRDPALAQLGAPPGRAGFRTVVASSNFLFNIDWGFVLLITKYRAAFAGYAPQYRDVIISFSMQPDILALPAVVAHEIGHTVGALDEYQPNCTVFQQGGFNNAPNANCEVGNPIFSTDCLMKNNAPKVCATTAGYFGWGDQDFDGVLDPFDPQFVTI